MSLGPEHGQLPWPMGHGPQWPVLGLGPWPKTDSGLGGHTAATGEYAGQYNCLMMPNLIPFYEH